jgi:mono/diheme cytochrome c family protein
LTALALSVSGCGAVNMVTSGDPSQGKALFLKNCGSCHVMADAGSQGTIGPNLDDAFASDKQQGFSVQTIRDVVRGQIAYPEKPMPADLVRGQDASDIAVYIATCSANPQCGVTAAGAPPAAGTTTSPAPSGTTTTAGGSSGGGASPSAVGKQVFTSAGCGACHTLKDAGTTGKVGPDLDQLKPSEAAVEKQVNVGGGAMPAFKGQLSDAQIKAVAAYVSGVAGK